MGFSKLTGDDGLIWCIGTARCDRDHHFLASIINSSARKRLMGRIGEERDCYPHITVKFLEAKMAARG
jgi:hypothetical protein